MSLFEQLNSKWEEEPVEIADLDLLLGTIESLWKETIKVLGPCSLLVPNGNPGYGELSFAFGSVIGLRSDTALYRAHVDNLLVVPKELANLNCFSMIQAGMHDQIRSRGLLFQKLKVLQESKDSTICQHQEAITRAFQIGKEAERLTNLFREGLKKLWEQFYMPA